MPTQEVQGAQEIFGDHPPDFQCPHLNLPHAANSNAFFSALQWVPPDISSEYPSLQLNQHKAPYSPVSPLTPHTHWAPDIVDG